MHTQRKIGFIILLPLFITIFEPTKLPATPAIAAGIPIKKITFPFKMNVANEAMFDAKLITFVLPFAKVKSYFRTKVKNNIKKAPVPGPKKPS